MMIAAFIILVVSMGVIFFRFLRGPSLWDRLLSAEMMGSVFVSMIVLLSIALDSANLIDVAMALTLVTFIGTAVVALRLENEVADD